MTETADPLRTRRILDRSPEIFIELDIGSIITEWSKAAEVSFGWTRDEIIGKSILDYVGSASREVIEVGMSIFGTLFVTETERDIALNETIAPLVVEFRHKDGTYVHAISSPFLSSVTEDDLRVGVYAEVRASGEVAGVTTVTDRRGAFLDALTGMPNRVAFVNALGEAIEKLAFGDGDFLHEGLAEVGGGAGAGFGGQIGGGGSVAVCCFNIDRFKDINDAWGHDTGDEVLVAVASRLSSADASLRPMIGRLGGDAFLALFQHPEDGAERLASAFAESVIASFGEPLTAAGREIFLHVSVGIASTDDPKMTPAMLLANADAAMHAGKAQGAPGSARGVSGHAVFGEELRAELEKRMETEHSLHRALERGELVVYYQPIVHVADASLSGVEALVRWNHPEQGLVPPLRFIPIAEESGLINPIGAWILQESCEQLVRWRGEGPDARDLSLTIEVNLSARQIDHPEIVSTIEQALEHTGLPADRLTLEITESALMRDADRALKVLGALKTIGVSLAIDDFGTGYSSLSYLQRFPLDVLKVDKSFVDNVEAGQAHEIVAAVINLAHGLEMRVVAEGVETEGQWHALRDMGCDEAQGYYFARPVPADQIDVHAGLVVPAPV